MQVTDPVAGMARSHIIASPCRRPPCGRHLMLWNQKGSDTGSLLFARMAASYKGLLQVKVDV